MNQDFALYEPNRFQVPGKSLISHWATLMAPMNSLLHLTVNRENSSRLAYLFPLWCGENSTGNDTTDSYPPG
jgi:hypothetical protein